MIETQTIDITHVNKILSNCPHYDDIVGYEYKDDDTLSKALIDWYKELIFAIDGKSEKELKIINVLDKSLYLYTKDHRYKKELKKIITVEDVKLTNFALIKEAIRKIISFTCLYEKKELLEFSNSKWL